MPTIKKDLFSRNLKCARAKWGIKRNCQQLEALKQLSEEFQLSISSGELILLNNNWFVTHAGLLGIAKRNQCLGIKVQVLKDLCDPATSRYAFEATVYKTRGSCGFGGYGDADPSNVSSIVRGAEMRVAETRAVNRALRKAYGIGICSVEEIGSAVSRSGSEGERVPPTSTNGKSWSTGPKVRDLLWQIIRQHQLDPTLVKAYAVDFCGTNSLREATREQVENFVQHLADWAEKDRNALLCQLNSYPTTSEGAA